MIVIDRDFGDEDDFWDDDEEDDFYIDTNDIDWDNSTEFDGEEYEDDEEDD